MHNVNLQSECSPGHIGNDDSGNSFAWCLQSLPVVARQYERWCTCKPLPWSVSSSYALNVPLHQHSHGPPLKGMIPCRFSATVIAKPIWASWCSQSEPCHLQYPSSKSASQVLSMPQSYLICLVFVESGVGHSEATSGKCKTAPALHLG